jgi:alpha-L-rhamnosidase
VWDEKNRISNWSETAFFVTGVLNENDWKAQWIKASDYLQQAMPLFRKEFKINKKIKQATAFVSGLGYSEFYLNGKKVGDSVLDPAQTNYESYAFYSTFDITDLLAENNCAGVMLGDGWYNQNKAFGIDLSYGKPVLLCQIQIEYENGETEIIGTDTTWLWAAGPVVSANVYAGETYDARLEIENWSKPGKVGGNWFPAELAENHPPALKSQLLPPIKNMKELAVQNFFPLEKGKTVFDFGQNFAGWVRIKVNEPRGTEIKIRMSEELYPDSSPDFTSTGVKATRFIQTDSYICKGEGTEIWEPRFTYHGFRYAEVSGLSSPPNSETVTGIVVYSSVDSVGTFRCSNEQINQLHKLAVWTLTSNLHGFPTDCPHREKCGWLGDAHAIAPMSVYNFDMEAFWIKYLHDIRSSAARSGVTLHHKEKNRVFYQAYKKAGIPFMISPGIRECGAASPDWGTALVQIPWYLYLYYGNTEVLSDFYPDMKLWVEYIDSLSVDNILYQGLGDWCPPGGNKMIDCPYELSSTAFHFLDLKIMAQAAKALNKRDEAEFFNTKKSAVKKAFIEKFYNAEAKTFGSQTANAMALDFGLVPNEDEKAVLDVIVQEVFGKGAGFPNTGIFGLPRIFDALAKNGNEEAAAKILTGKGKRSFENMWKIYGATTLWEILPIEFFPDSGYMRNQFGSHNHPMQGGFDTWFYRGIAGISPVVEQPGFRTIEFEPLLVNQLEWAEATFQSKYGLVKSAWKWNGNALEWEIVVPPNCTGNVIIPITDFSELSINGIAASSSSTTINNDNGKQMLTLGSGQYKLIIQTNLLK